MEGHETSRFQLQTLMQKNGAVMTAGGLLLAGLLGVRVVQLEQRSAVRESPPEAVRKTAGPQAYGTKPVASADDTLAAPGEAVRAELENLRAELAGLRKEVAALEKKRRESARATAASGIQPGDWQSHTGFLSPPRERIEHWTGGDKRRWGHEQAAGEPDTHQPGDIPSAWASKDPDGGEEWLQLDYDRAVDLQQINVIESHNPGAISKVAAVLPDGSETIVWEGSMDASEADELVSSEFSVAGNVHAQSVKVYLDTARVPGWNEIDAVQIVGRDGSKQWATASRASSSYADP